MRSCCVLHWSFCLFFSFPRRDSLFALRFGCHHSTITRLHIIYQQTGELKLINDCASFLKYIFVVIISHPSISVHPKHIYYSGIRRWIVGSILLGGPIELFPVPASVPRLVQQRPWYVLSCLWDSAYKRTLAADVSKSVIIIIIIIQYLYSALYNNYSKRFTL